MAADTVLRGAGRAAAVAGRVPPWTGRVVMLALAALLPLVSSTAPNLDRYEVTLTTLLVVIGFNLMFGYAGELSLVQPVVMGCSAYAAGVLSSVEGWGAIATLPIAIVVGVVLGLVLNSVSLRLKGWYLAVTTIFAVAVFPDLITVFSTWTQGTYGLRNIQPLPWVDLSVLGNSVREYEVVLAIAAVFWLAFRNLETSRWGLTLRALRDCRYGLVSCGANQMAIRAMVTVVACIPVAVAGWLTAHVNMVLVPTTFGFSLLLFILGAVMLGGRGTVWGPVIGTVVFEGVNQWIGPFSDVNELVLGLAVLGISAIFPIGLAGAWRRAIRPWLEARVPLPPPAPEPAAATTAEPAAATAATAPAAAAVPTAGARGDVVLPTRAPARPAAAVVDLPPVRGWTPRVEGDAGPPLEPVLVAHGIRRTFGGVVALDDAGIELRPGTVTGLVGPNGSGKTTFLNVLTGFVKSEAGTLTLDGRDVTNAVPYMMARSGVRRSFQTPQLVGELTVAENIMLGMTGPERQRIWSCMLRTPGYRRRGSQLAFDLEETCAALGLTARMDTPIDELPLGVRRIVEIGRAIVSLPRVVCLDEPAAGLSEVEVQSLLAVLRRLADLGFAVLLIEHNLAFVEGVSNTIVAMDHGRVVEVRAGGASTSARVPATLEAIAEVGPDREAEVEAELDHQGSLPEAAAEAAAAPVPAGAGPAAGEIEPPPLEVAGLSAWYGQAQALYDVSLRVDGGEIVGVLGENGAGKSTLLRSIGRAHRKVAGSVQLGGWELCRLNAAEASVGGITLVREGALVFADLTILEHLAFARRLARRRGRTPMRDEEIWTWLPILHERRHQKAGYLSGGQRQLLALAMAAMSRPSCLLLDEPSAGLAESVREVVFDCIRTVAAQGSTLLIAEQSDRWLRGLASRSYVLEVGRLREEVVVPAPPKVRA